MTITPDDLKDFEDKAEDTLKEKTANARRAVLDFANREGLSLHARVTLMERIVEMLGNADFYTMTSDGIDAVSSGRPIMALGAGNNSSPADDADTEMVNKVNALARDLGTTPEQLFTFLRQLFAPLFSLSEAERNARSVAMSNIARGDTKVKADGSVDIKVPDPIDPPDVNALKTEIKELKQERDKFHTAANNNLTWANAAMRELNKLTSKRRFTSVMDDLPDWLVEAIKKGEVPTD